MVWKSRKQGRKYRVFAWLIWIVSAMAIVATLLLLSMLSWWGGVILIVAAVVMGHLWMYRPGGVPALIYHSVSAAPGWLPWRSEISVKPETFALHLATIKKMGCTVLSSEEFIHLRKNRAPIPPKSVLIHLDDGYLDNWVAAYPLLKQFDMCATLFISTDFVEEGDTVRATISSSEGGQESTRDLCWNGYVNWAELQQMEQSGVISVQAHGTDHARGEVDQVVVNTLNENNWRLLIWKQWQGMDGNKSDWYKFNSPPCFPFGTTIKNNIPALSDPILTDKGVLESLLQYEVRVKGVFERVREVIRVRMGKDVSIFCWPHNVFSERAHALALQCGFHSTTAGMGENRDGDDYQRISRVHVHENALGLYWAWSESLALRANIRLFQGNYYWYLVLIVMNASRKLIKKLSKEWRA